MMLLTQALDSGDDLFCRHGSVLCQAVEDRRDAVHGVLPQQLENTNEVTRSGPRTMLDFKPVS